ncbi:MAG TPA: hypothetical protein VKO43_04995 [Candidatus Krumholzibacteriaceae bacterium]|nr:hypothetical protein [Candidatus Krumholzibacteriaceae bacterium]
MTKKKVDKSSEKRVVLVIVSLVLIAFAGIVMGVNSISLSEPQPISNRELKKQVFSLAEGGVKESIKYISRLPVPLEGRGANKDQPILLYQEKSLYGIGTVTSYLDPLDSDTERPAGFAAITVRAILSGSGLSRVVRVKVGQLNFNNYSYFSGKAGSISGTGERFFPEDNLRGSVLAGNRFYNPRAEPSARGRIERISWRELDPSTDITVNFW